MTVGIPPAPTIPGVTHTYSGKVRDIYAYPDGRLLFVASDRMSAYDWVLPTTIPDKGRVLTTLTLWWFEKLADLVPNHLVSTDVPAQVAGRAMVTERLEMFPVECVARGYLTGSGLSDYRATRGRLRYPTPGAGSSTGRGCPRPSSRRRQRQSWATHDENVDFEAVAKTVGEAEAEAAADADPAGLLPRRRDCPQAWDHPRRHQARVRSPRGYRGRSCWATRSSPPTRRGSGRPTAGARASRSRRSTSSTSGTG